MKRFLTPISIVIGLFSMAAASATECKPTDVAVKTAVTAKTAFPTADYNVVIGNFQYDAGNKTCSGWVMVDHKNKPMPWQIDNLQVVAPK